MKSVFVAATLAFGSTLVPAQVQPTEKKIPLVGFLAPQGRSLPLFGAFQKGMAELGYVEGSNVVIEPRFGEGHPERLPELAAELARLKVDVLAVTGAVTARAVKKTGTDIPIVFCVVVDPVADNVVPNLERPGGSVTGVTTFDPQQPRKQLELLREVKPGLKHVTILGDKGVSEALINASEKQARALGMDPQPIRVSVSSSDLDAAFSAIRKDHAEALLILEEPALGVHANRIAELAAQDRLPTLFPPSRVSAGGLLNYGTSQTEGIRRMTPYVDKILKGAKPGELPVETVTRYELIVNQKTAKDIGVTIPPELLNRADKVIQ